MPATLVIGTAHCFLLLRVGPAYYRAQGHTGRWQRPVGRTTPMAAYHERAEYRGRQQLAAQSLPGDK